VVVSRVLAYIKSGSLDANDKARLLEKVFMEIVELAEEQNAELMKKKDTEPKWHVLTKMGCENR
jgi:hypothetical protein